MLACCTSQPKTRLHKFPKLTVLASYNNRNPVYFFSFVFLASLRFHLRGTNDGWLKCCFTSTETVWLIRDGEMGGGSGCGGGERGRLYTYRYTVTTRMIPALRRAAMRAIFNVSVGSDGQSQLRQCPQTTTFFKRKESRSGFEQRSFRLPA